MKEQLIPAIIFLFVGMLLVSLGLLVHKFRYHNLISGYNTMSEEKKAQFDIENYARIFGIVFYTMGLLIMLGGPIFYLFFPGQQSFILCLIIIIIGGVAYLNVLGWVFKRRSGRR